MPVLKRFAFCLGLLALVFPAVSVVGAGTASAGLSVGRACTSDSSSTELITSNGFRLTVCARMWYPDGAFTQARGVVEMHSYRRSGTKWVDSTAQSITLNQATLTRNGLGALNFGQDSFNPGSTPDGGNTCRVNGPAGGLITCSVPNTSRVAYYSTAWQGVAQEFGVFVHLVSFRDATGAPHTWSDPAPGSVVQFID